jgi:hypothetical protein
MIDELWGSFPRLLEQNVNGLLDGAGPNRTKAFMLYKACKNEDLYSGDFEKFTEKLEAFYSRPKAFRKKSDFDRMLDRPMDQDVFAGFHLNFRTAHIPEKSVDDLASWAHNVIRVAKKTASAVISLEVIGQTLKSIVQPPPHAKAENIEFEDFCEAWKKTVFKFFGRNKDTELELIVKELRWINAELKAAEENPRKVLSFPTIYLTQTELDWANAVRSAAIDRTRAPKFPLSRGPLKQRLNELERVATLYETVRTSTLPELIKYRERIRATLLDRCENLLGERPAA